MVRRAIHVDIDTTAYRVAATRSKPSGSTCRGPPESWEIAVIEPTHCEDSESRLHIHAPASLATRIVWRRCYGCVERSPVFLRSPLLVRFYEWYDPSATCLRCGEHIGHERPWSPRWRVANRRRALATASRLGLRVPKTVMLA